MEVATRRCKREAKVETVVPRNFVEPERAVNDARGRHGGGPARDPRRCFARQLRYAVDDARDTAERLNHEGVLRLRKSVAEARARVRQHAIHCYAIEMCGNRGRGHQAAQTVTHDAMN
jgi:hypothetical protein